MNKYIDLVVAKHSGSNGRFLFRAPAFSHLEKADEVVCETTKGASTASVIASVTVGKGSKEYEFIKDVCKAYEPIKRVLAKVEYIQFKYENEEEDDAVDSN